MTIGDTTFSTIGENDELSVAALLSQNGQRISIHKTHEMLDALGAVIEDVAPRNIVELGIAQGGGTAFLAQLAQPKKLVAIERDPTSVAALDEYVESHGLQETVKTYYGLDQADRSALDTIMDSEFGPEPLDLVSDDASHLLRETRVSFNCLFPRLRPGGVYLIEDWAWGHYDPDMVPTDMRDRWRAVWPTGVPLTVLAFELVMACASSNRIIDDVSVDRDFVRVRRGPGEIDPGTFDISRSFIEGSVKLLAPDVYR